jgi:hypothetical protein
MASSSSRTTDGICRSQTTRFAQYILYPIQRCSNLLGGVGIQKQDCTLPSDNREYCSKSLKEELCRKPR